MSQNIEPKSDWHRPAFDGSMPDPFVLRHGGRWYAFATGRVVEGRAINLLVSDDFETWTPAPGPLIPPAGSEGADFWAPEVAAGDDGKFYLYYSFGVDGGKVGHALRVAVADEPAGPYHDVGRPLVGDGSAFTIDPHPFKDEDGQWYLFYAADFADSGLDERGRYHAGTSVVVDRLLDMHTLAGEPKTLIRARHRWTLYEDNRTMSQYGPDPFHWHTIEGAFVRKHAGTYWMMFSGGRYGGAGYGVDVVHSTNVDGPYAGEGADAPQVLSTQLAGLPGPGHHSITTGPDGREYFAFHAWNPDLTVRRMHLAPLEWTAEGPRLARG